MAQIPVRLNTQQMAFPLLSQLMGRTIISGQGDLTYVPGVSVEGEIPQDRGVPGLLYCENIVPSTYGWQSIGYTEKVPASASGVEFTGIKLIQGAVVTGGGGNIIESSNRRTYISKGTTGTTSRLYALNSNNEWRVIPNSPTFSSSRNFSVAQVRGFSYICIERQGVYVYNVAANSLITRDLKGITDSTIVGITASSGYLIVFTQRRVLWSSVVDPEDFVPDEITGAGGGGVEEAAGSIVACLPTILGFIVYTTANAVSAVYSGNEEFPWNFKAIPSVGGIYDAKLVSEETANGYHYAYTTNGIQRITHNQSNTILPSVSDFIDGNLYEWYDEGTEKLEQTVIVGSMNRRLHLVANRYMIISYAPTSQGVYEFALIIDLASNRMGKLRKSHTKVFEWREREAGTFLDSRSSIALLAEDGQVQVVNFDLAANSGEGIFLLGKLQLTRTRMAQLHRVEVENIQPGVSFELKDWLSYDGKSYDETVSGYNNSDINDMVREFLFCNVGLNHTLVFKGTFNILSVIVHLGVHGKS